MLAARTIQLLDETLPQAYHCFDMEALASGQMVIQVSVVDSFIRDRLQYTLPDGLRRCVQIETVNLTWAAVPYDPDHWLGDRQPAMIPVVVCQVRIVVPFGPAITIRRSAELILEGP